MDIIPFTYDDRQVRVVTIDGEPWFVAKDVAIALGYADPTNAIKAHCKGVANHHPLPTTGGVQQVRIISEPDVLRLIVSSKLPTAEAFERLVFEEILPTIRKTGGYGVQQLTEDEIVAQALVITTRKVEALEAKVQADAPKVHYVDVFVADADLRVLRDVAKSLGLQEKRLRGALLQQGWIFAERDTRWSRSEGKKVEQVRYSAYAHKRDYFRPVPRHDAPRFKGEVDHTLKITPAGAEAIARAAVRWGLIEEEVAS